MPYKKNAIRSFKPKRRTIRRSKSIKVNSAVKQYVNRTISRSEETKIVSVQYAFSRFNSAISSPGDIITLMPQLGQGLTQDSRIGNTIRPLRMEITGYVCYDTAQTTNNADARMLGARLFIYQDKSNRAVENAVYNYNLITLGGTSFNYTGTAMNYISPNNKDQFTFFSDKKMIILKPYGFTNVTTPSSTVSLSSMDKSMFHPFKVVLNQKQLPAVLKYDQADNTSYPVNFNPKLALGYSDMLNASPDTTSTQIGLSFCCTLFYKDG